MKIGIVGIGDICRKAYLPVISAHRGIELVLCTRNRETLAEVSEQYRIERVAYFDMGRRTHFGGRGASAPSGVVAV